MTFTLDNWANRKYVTRDGRPARIVCVDAANYHPIVALVEEVEGYEYPHRYDKDGRYITGSDGKDDLQDVPEEHTVWFVHEKNAYLPHPFPNKEEADAYRSRWPKREISAIVKVTYKEGQMDE
jgi:hypothetical protein